MSERRGFAGRLLLVVNLAAANAAAAVIVLGFVRPGFVGVDAGVLGQAFADQRVAVLPLGTRVAIGVFIAALLLLLLNFAWLVRRAPQAPPDFVVSETPTGSVRVAREALEAGLRAAGEALPEITRLRVQVDTAANKWLLVHGQFQVAEGLANLAASQRLRQALRDRFGAMVRPTPGTRVEFDLEFQGFAGKLPKKAGETAPALEPEHQPFTGPQYPIDDEEPPGSAH